MKLSPFSKQLKKAKIGIIQLVEEIRRLRFTKTIEKLATERADATRGERTVIAVLLAYDLIWTLYGVVAESSQDLNTDMTEMFAWSRELAFGYSKHPPLGAWLTAAWFTIFPIADWAFHFLAVTIAAFSLWIAWRIAGDYLDRSSQVVALALLMLVPFFNFHALKFNANTVLLPMWGATTLCFLRSFERRSNTWAALAGLCAAGAMLGKYWSIFLIIGLGFAALVDPRRNTYFRSAAPWITITVGAIGLAPHIAWLSANNFSPFHYATSVHVNTHLAGLASVVGYLVGSASYVAFPVLLVLVAIKPNRTMIADMLWPATAERRLVATAFWAPLLVPAVAAPLTGMEITSLWSMSAWTLLPVVLLSSSLIKLDRGTVSIIATIATALPLLMVIIAPEIAIGIALHPGGDAPAKGLTEPLAKRVAQEWRKRTERPLRFVGGDAELAYGVAFYSPSRPSAFPDFNGSTAPWVNLALVRRDGIAIVCRVDNSTCTNMAVDHGLAGSQIEVRIAPSYFGVAAHSTSYAIIIVLPATGDH